MHGQPHRVIYDPHSQAARAAAAREAAAYAEDSLHDLRLAPVLRLLPASRVTALWRSRRLAYDRRRQLLVPVVGGGAPLRYIDAPNASNAGVLVATATTAKTLLQLATPSNQQATLAWYQTSFDGSAAGKPLTVELIEVDVAATVTALTPTKYTDPNSPASLCVGGTAATGYNASAEGAVTASRLLDFWLLAPTQGMLVQWPYGREPVVQVSKFLRLRVTGSSGVTPNAAVAVVHEE